MIAGLVFAVVCNLATVLVVVLMVYSVRRWRQRKPDVIRELEKELTKKR